MPMPSEARLQTALDKSNSHSVSPFSQSRRDGVATGFVGVVPCGARRGQADRRVVPGAQVAENLLRVYYSSRKAWRSEAD